MLHPKHRPPEKRPILSLRTSQLPLNTAQQQNPTPCACTHQQPNIHTIFFYSAEYLIQIKCEQCN